MDFSRIPLLCGLIFLVGACSAKNNDNENAVAEETVAAGDQGISDTDIEYDYVGVDEFIETPSPPRSSQPASTASQPSPVRSREELVVFTVEAVVKSISDGDTISLQHETGARFSIRMSDMDTPEVAHDEFTPRNCRCKTVPYRPGQPGGAEATLALQSLVSVGDKVKAECYEADQYARLVCHIFKGQTNINLEMIKNGWGWLPSRSEWVRDSASASAEQQARSTGLGAWGLENQVSPREWRQKCWKNGECEGSPTPRP